MDRGAQPSHFDEGDSELIKNQFRIISGYTDSQIEKLDLVWKLMRNSWNLSRDDMIRHPKNNTIVNSNVAKSYVLRMA